MSKTFVKICRWALGILGFAGTASSCDEPVCMYGMPIMDYTISGKVQNEDGEPVKGIEVTTDDDCYGNVASSGADGTFSLKSQHFPRETLTIQARDVDGPENGEYLDKDQEVTLKQTAKGDGSWYEGAFEAKDVVIVLSEKK